MIITVYSRWKITPSDEVSIYFFRSGFFASNHFVKWRVNCTIYRIASTTQIFQLNVERDKNDVYKDISMLKIWVSWRKGNVNIIVSIIDTDIFVLIDIVFHNDLIDLERLRNRDIQLEGVVYVISIQYERFPWRCCTRYFETLGMKWRIATYHDEQPVSCEPTTRFTT